VRDRYDAEGPSIIGYGRNCWGATDAEGMSGRNRYVMFDGTGGWQRFRTEIHVRCESKRIKLSVCVAALRKGKLTFYWDGVEIAHTPSAADLFNKMPLPIEDLDDSFGDYHTCSLSRLHEVYLDLHGHDGGHTLTAEFQAYEPFAQAKLIQLELQMNHQFAVCEDMKACLSTMIGDGEQGLKLRMENELQFQCLDAQDSSQYPSSVKTACTSWRECLEKNTEEDHRSRLLLMLRAAGHGDSHASASMVQATSKPAAPEECLDPATTDPESWECDCYDEAMSLCSKMATRPEYTEKKCMRALYCNRGDVCSSWKQSACADPQVQQLQQALLAESSLLERARTSEKQAESSSELNEALISKACV
jgi:hypothetical protein